ncbi:hypothetical protein HNR23_003464 [Nocardiopsis mwathae]|uniref:Uncharacterized protein n=1 Tax=Nocardiopsis mwathae TaxID=1472723 RepID=A0A7X0D7V6_9ACTN|nr:hypothetical protein [Nocardiopsis mwathae]MBB6173404.1 hypothetical protein [Nocardiopsis mwathae]
MESWRGKRAKIAVLAAVLTAGSVFVADLSLRNWGIESVESDGASAGLDSVRPAYSKDDLDKVRKSLTGSEYGEVKHLLRAGHGTVAVLETGVVSVDNDSLKVRWSYSYRGAPISAGLTPIDKYGDYNDQRVVLSFDSMSLLGPVGRIITIEAATGEVVSDSSISNSQEDLERRVRWLTSDSRISVLDTDGRKSLEAHSLESGDYLWDFQVPSDCSLGPNEDAMGDSIVTSQGLVTLSYSCEATNEADVVALDSFSGNEVWSRSWESQNPPNLSYADALQMPYTNGDPATSIVKGEMGGNYIAIDIRSGENDDLYPWSAVREVDNYIPAPLADRAAPPEYVLIGHPATTQNKMIGLVASELISDGVISVDDFEGTYFITNDASGNKIPLADPAAWKLGDSAAAAVQRVIERKLSSN